MSAKVEFACPKCGAKPQEHGKGECRDDSEMRSEGECQGFLCECDDWDSDEEHGTIFTDVCTNAVCHHCNWFGAVPQKPKGVQSWETKAIEAGWTPPADRAKQLGLVVAKKPAKKTAKKHVDSNGVSRKLIRAKPAKETKTS